jgi:hypothetical protein
MAQVISPSACSRSGRGARRATLLAAALAGCLAIVGVSVAAGRPLREPGDYTHFCPPGGELAHAARIARAPLASAAEASHAGWPAKECLVMDKGPPGQNHTLVGEQDVHNWLLGGNGNDTIFAGARGDVIWGDYQPSGQPESQVDRLHGGAGADWIYSSHGFNEIWTGAGNDHLLLVYGHGIVYCDGAGLKTFVMDYLPQNRPWTLMGCSHKVIDRYRV